MITKSTKSIPSLIGLCIAQVLSLAVLVSILLTFVYGFIYHYQQKQAHVKQIIELLAISASNPEDAGLVAKQVERLLANDITIQNISFYATDQPIVATRQVMSTQQDMQWQDALFADAISFNHAVTSGYIADEESILVGYINATLDVKALRSQWIRNTLPLWLVTMVLAITVFYFLLRKLKWPTRDVAQMAQVCKMIINDPKYEQLPVMQQQFEFQELSYIKQAFILVFERLRLAKQNYEALYEFEQHLYDKDLSLEMQRHNFQSMITHELKTSLNAITGGLQLLEDQYLNEEQTDTLAIISKGSQRLELTLEQIIQLNKIEKGHISIQAVAFDPLEIIADLLIEFEPLAKQKQLELVSKVNHIDHTLEGDAYKIRQILSALIDNAIKFTDEGQVTIESQLTHFDKSIRWNIKIIDTGIGIDNNYIDDIYTPFFQVDSSNTRSYEGAGIGLPIVQQMLTLIGANIETSSQLGVGSQFAVMIPLRYKLQAQPQLLAGLKIIYYSMADSEFLVEALQQLGATVICRKHERLILEQVMTTAINIVMFGEDIEVSRAATLATSIREVEYDHRTLLVYWYAEYATQSVDSFSHVLKAAGVDYCHNVTRNPIALSKLLKKWLALV